MDPALHVTTPQNRQRRFFGMIFPAGRESALSSLDLLARKHGTGKGPDAHGYTAAYHAFLDPLREREVRLLEIGIGTGASLRMWEEYLPNARLYAIDEDPAAIAHASERTRVFIGDQTDPAFLAQVAGVTGELDVVIDDGSHHPDHQRVSLEALFPHVRDGGLYAIEDLGCAFSPRYGPAAGLGNPASVIEYLKGMLDVIHASPTLGGHLGDAISARVRALHLFPQLAILVKGPAREPTADAPDARVPKRPLAPWLDARIRRAAWRLQKLRRRLRRRFARRPSRDFEMRA
jgi:demethylmacrocin O-methyltransferase